MTTYHPSNGLARQKKEFILFWQWTNRTRNIPYHLGSRPCHHDGGLVGHEDIILSGQWISGIWKS